MISRRILRTKVLQTIYSYYQSSNTSINNAEKELFHSIEKSYDLYFYLLLVIQDVLKYADSRFELGRQKLIPTLTDLNPNTKLLSNKLVAQLAENKQLNTHLSRVKMSWVNHPELIKKLYNDFNDSAAMQDYLNSNDNSYAADKKIIIYFYEEILYNTEMLYQILEEQSIYWIDSVEFIISMVIKSLNKFQIGYDQTFPLLSMFKNDDDKEFVKTLFRKTVLNKDKYREIIASHSKHWDFDRIAFLDTLILQLALTEIIEFPDIPINVSFNEYLEISKQYSTSKSSAFINGILDKIIQGLIKDEVIKKAGKGLLNESVFNDSNE